MGFGAVAGTIQGIPDWQKTRGITAEVDDSGWYPAISKLSRALSLIHQAEAALHQAAGLVKNTAEDPRIESLAFSFESAGFELEKQIRRMEG